MTEKKKMCISCLKIKSFDDYDIDHQDATDRTAKCKICRGTAPVKAARKSSRKYKSEPEGVVEDLAVEPELPAIGDDVDASLESEGDFINDIESEGLSNYAGEVVSKPIGED